jgi:hypothetical protein
MTIQRHTLPGGEAAIYGETANINFFVETDLEADAAGAVVNRQSNVRAHTRRRFPNDDTPTNVAAHDREWLQDPGRRNGAATPGKDMVLVAGDERRAFTYTGPWMDVHAWLVGDVAQDTTAYSESARYDIAAPAAEG